MDKVEDIVGQLKGRNKRLEDLYGGYLYYTGMDAALDATAIDLIQSQQALIEEMREAMRNSAMYLKTGFIECDRCGHEVETKNTDAEYTLRSALSQKDQIDG